MAQKVLWNIAKKRMLEDRGALPREHGDFLRENQAMHADNFLSSWLQEDVEGKEEENKKMSKDANCGSAFLETSSLSDDEGNPTRPRGTRHSLSLLVDHFSLDTVDPLPCNTPEISFPARLYTFEDHEAVIRMIIKGRSPNLSHV